MHKNQHRSKSKADSNMKQPSFPKIPGPKLKAGLNHAVNKSSAYLSRENFCEAVCKLAIQKFPKCTKADIAWKHLVEGHLMPVADRRAGRFDEYMTTLLSPVVTETLAEWEVSLKLTFKVSTPSQMSLL